MREGPGRVPEDREPGHSTDRPLLRASPVCRGRTHRARRALVPGWERNQASSDIQISTVAVYSDNGNQNTSSDSRCVLHGFQGFRFDEWHVTGVGLGLGGFALIFSYSPRLWALRLESARVGPTEEPQRNI